MAACKKNSARLGAHLIFVDESGFLLTPSVRKTWAPVGQTPLIHHRFRNDRISVIAGITVSPVRRRLNLLWALSFENIRQPDVCEFLHQVLLHFRGHVIALLDNSLTHRGNLIKDLQYRFRRLHLEYFPAYAPELNPQEGVWGRVKRQLANGRPDDIYELEQDLRKKFSRVARSREILRGCIHESDLPFILS